MAEHKKRYNCTGKRTRTEFVAPLRTFTDHMLHRDFGLLEEVDYALDRADRSYRVQHTELRLSQQKRHFARIALARACAERGIKLILAPAALNVARNNSSQLRGGSGSHHRNHGGWWRRPISHFRTAGKPQWITWKVEWHFEKSSQVLCDRALPEHEVLGPTLARFLNNTCHFGATRHLLLPYIDAGLDQLEVFLHQPSRTEAGEGFGRTRGKFAGIDESSDEDEDEDGGEEKTRKAATDSVTDEETEEEDGEDGEKEEEDKEQKEEQDQHRKPKKRKTTSLEMPTAPGAHFQRLDKGKSLRENLQGHAVVEFPALYVALPQELARYTGIATTNTDL